MSDLTTEQLRAAIDRLEAERARRIAEKVESGKAVLVPFLMTAGYAPDEASIKRAKDARLAELRAQGEAREVFFDEMVIVTGVPRRSDEQFGPMPEGYCSVPAPGVRIMDQPPKDPEPRKEAEPTVATAFQRIWIQVSPASEKDPGSIAEARFTVSGNAVHLEGLDGKPLGSQPLQPGQDAATIARQLLRQKTARSGFWGPLPQRRWFQ